MLVRYWNRRDGGDSEAASLPADTRPSAPLSSAVSARLAAIFQLAGRA
jgi:hypothetical protein